jgi:CheY-like chemotaxis protein
MRKILIADDSAFFLQIIRENVRSLSPDAAGNSYKIFECRSGNEVLETYEKQQPFGRYDMAVLDIHMPPGPNGIELTREFKKGSPEMKVYILTNYNLPEYREAAKEAGADDYFFKDDMQDFNSCLDRFIKEIKMHSKECLDDAHYRSTISSL